MLCEILSVDVYADPKEKKRQRERERYAKNKDEILKRRHQLRELRKQSTTPVNDENTLNDTQAIGQSGVTQVQYMDTEEGHCSIYLTHIAAIFLYC